MGQVETMSVEKTAKLIRKDPQYVRLGLQQGRLPFGSAVQKETGHWSYNIIAQKVREYAGIKEECTNE